VEQAKGFRTFQIPPDGANQQTATTPKILATHKVAQRSGYRAGANNFEDRPIPNDALPTVDGDLRVHTDKEGSKNALHLV
jgi:hypothetical protein